MVIENWIIIVFLCIEVLALTIGLIAGNHLFPSINETPYKNRSKFKKVLTVLSYILMFIATIALIIIAIIDN